MASANTANANGASHPGEDNWPQLKTTLPSLGMVLLGYLAERHRITR